MTQHFDVQLPIPRYAVGTIILALIDHQPRYAEITRAHLSVQLTADETGMSIDNSLRWEYDVNVLYEEEERDGSRHDLVESMVIAEKTIIRVIEPPLADEQTTKAG